MTRRTTWMLLLLAWSAALVAGTHWPGLDVARGMGFKNSDVPMGLDKWLHLSAYAGLAVLAFCTRNSREPTARGPRRAASRQFTVLALLFLFAALDEWTQQFIPSRTSRLGDFYASSLGILLGACSFFVTRWLVNHDGSFVAHTRVVSALTLLSRAFGLVRDAVLGRVFGLGVEFDAFTIAFMVPNLFRRLFGEGALSAAFIPRYTKLNRDDPAAARRFAAVVVNTLFLGLLVLAIAVATVLGAVGYFAPLSERGWMVVSLTTVTIFYMPLICTSAILGGLAQVHGRFGPFAASPILLNIFMIASAATGYYALFAGEEALFQVSLLIAAAVVFSGWLQVLWGFWAIRSAGVPLREFFAMSKVSDFFGDSKMNDSLRELWRATWPAALGLSVFQLNTLCDQLIAWFFSATAESGPTMHLLGFEVAYPMQAGSVAAMGRAQLLYEFPHGVFGIAVATAIFPALAKAALDRVEFSQLLRQGLRLCVFIGLPASVGLWMLREPVCRAIFFPGDQLAADDSTRIAAILGAFAPAIWAYSTNVVLTRAFYAQHDTVTPMRLSLAMVGLNIVLNFTLIWPLGTPGLAWATAICAMVQTVILLRLVRRYADTPCGGEVAGSWVNTVIVTEAMAIAVYLALRQFDVNALNRWELIGLVAGLSALGAAVVGLGSLILKMDEPRWLLRGK